MPCSPFLPFSLPTQEHLRTKLLPALEREDATLREVGRKEQVVLAARAMDEDDDSDDSDADGEDWTLTDSVQELDERFRGAYHSSSSSSSSSPCSSYLFF